MFEIIPLVIILFLLIILSMVWPPNSPWSPWWRTSKRTAAAICRLAGIAYGDVVYELGSGDGNFLLIACGVFGAKGIGIEIDPIRVLISKVRIYAAGLSSRIEIIRQDFFKTHMGNASVVYVYLVPKALIMLLPKLKNELKKGTRIVSLDYPMDLPLIKEDKLNKIRLYIL